MDTSPTDSPEIEQLRAENRELRAALDWPRDATPRAIERLRIELGLSGECEPSEVVARARRTFGLAKFADLIEQSIRTAPATQPLGSMSSPHTPEGQHPAASEQGRAVLARHEGLGQPADSAKWESWQRREWQARRDEGTWSSFPTAPLMTRDEARADAWQRYLRQPGSVAFTLGQTSRPPPGYIVTNGSAVFAHRREDSTP